MTRTRATTHQEGKTKTITITIPITISDSFDKELASHNEKLPPDANKVNRSFVITHLVRCFLEDM